VWITDIFESKRVCPFRERTCCVATFDSYQQMLAHCRQKHPDTIPFGGDYGTELVVTDILGKVLNREEIRRVVDHPSFWPRPQELRLVRDHEEVA
jgi:hypothetical protein